MVLAGVSIAHEQVQHGHRVRLSRGSCAYDTGSGSMWPSLHTAESEQLEGEIRGLDLTNEEGLVESRGLGCVDSGVLPNRALLLLGSEF